MTSRNWCFTINNPSPEDIPELWAQEDLAKIKLLCYQLEMGESGTPHYQGYLETVQPIRLSGLKKFPGLRTAHLESRKGSRQQALIYCSKDESRLGDPLLFYEGTWEPFVGDFKESWIVEQSKAMTTQQNLSIVKDKLRDGSTSIEDVADEHFDLWVKYYRAFEKYITMKTEPRNSAVDVHVLQGPTGTGKSKWALDTYPGAYWKQRSNWWCGYFKHDVVIIDEFYGWLPFDLLLRLCDRYPLLVETKGGQMQFVATTIVITTNQLPSSWYKSCYFPAFARRVTKWHVLPIFGAHFTCDTWSEASKHMVENVVNP